ncbi:unnamed protein product, partial [Oppiella nova]
TYLGTPIIPKDPNPVIIGKKSHYTLNDMVNLTCTSPLSLPPAQLSATINGTPIGGDDHSTDNRFQHRIYYQKYENNLSSSSINIQFSTKYLTHRLPFECHSTITHRHNRSTEVNLWTRHKNPQHLHHNSDEHNDADLNIFYTDDKPIDEDNQTPEDSSEPTISGLKVSYGASDVVNVSCVSSRYKPMPELKWFINKQEVDPKYLTREKPIYYGDGYSQTTLRLHYSLQTAIKPSKTSKSNKIVVNLKCVESLTQVLTTGKETLNIPSAVEPISDNTVGAGCEAI